MSMTSVLDAGCTASVLLLRTTLGGKSLSTAVVHVSEVATSGATEECLMTLRHHGVIGRGAEVRIAQILDAASARDHILSLCESVLAGALVVLAYAEEACFWAILTTLGLQTELPYRPS